MLQISVCGAAKETSTHTHIQKKLPGFHGILLAEHQFFIISFMEKKILLGNQIQVRRQICTNYFVSFHYTFWLKF